MGQVPLYFILREEGFKEITWATVSRELESGSSCCVIPKLEVTARLIDTGEGVKKPWNRMDLSGSRNHI